jgi:two-component system, LuxR family, sensor kinase FixL
MPVTDVISTDADRDLRTNAVPPEAERSAAQTERLAAIGWMFTVLSHESRNALHQLRLSLALLARLVSASPEALAQAAAAQRAANYLCQLLEDVRGYAGPVSLHREWCDVAAIIGDAWNSLLPLHGGRSVQVSRDISPVYCPVDRPRMERVFRNILENALAACADPVEITWRASEGWAAGRPVVRIALRDNGPGLSAAQRRKVFEAFYTTKAEGSGLGLAICKRIVEAHGGEIAVEGAPGQGATFVITLPSVE